MKKLPSFIIWQLDKTKYLYLSRVAANTDGSSYDLGVKSFFPFFQPLVSKKSKSRPVMIGEFDL